jgi:hypothetical protein
MASESTTPDEKKENEHTSLKYSLLGPSLTKSGQDSVNQSKVRGGSQSIMTYILTFALPLAGL